MSERAGKVNTLLCTCTYLLEKSWKCWWAGPQAADPAQNGAFLQLCPPPMSCIFRPTPTSSEAATKKSRSHPAGFPCCPAELCLHLCPYRINKAILVCSEVKYTNLERCGGTFNHYLLMFRPVKSIMSILCSDKRYCRETPCHYFLVAVGVFLQQNIVCSE